MNCPKCGTPGQHLRTDFTQDGDIIFACYLNVCPRCYIHWEQCELFTLSDQPPKIIVNFCSYQPNLECIDPEGYCEDCEYCTERGL